MLWHLSTPSDPRGRVLADRHYNRQKIGAKQFAPPGRKLVLLTREADALWITSWPFAEYVLHEWAGAWVCSCFRNESSILSSELIRQAVAATRFKYPEVPELGMITFVNAEKTRRRRSKRSPIGKCFLEAGFKAVGMTKSGLHAFQLEPFDMPEPKAAYCPGDTLFAGLC